MVPAAAMVPAVALLVACPIPRTEKPGAAIEEARIVVTERGPSGGRLVFVAEDGRRLADLTQLGVDKRLDKSPSWSPNGRFIVFESTKNRTLTKTSLWIARAEPRSVMRPLTAHTKIDRHPEWSPDGTQVVFASDRSGSFQLWMLAVDSESGTIPRGALAKQITSGPGAALSPTWSPDGHWLAYMVLDELGDSSLWIVSASGKRKRRLTRGKRDIAPAWSPDGQVIAFASRPPGRPDFDLYTIRRDGTGKRRVVDEPCADQTGPVWSRDGRYLFATSVYRSVRDGKPVLGSVTVVDLHATPRVVRALHDPAAVESRLGPALSPEPLSARLTQAPAYEQALRTLFDRIDRQRRDAQGQQTTWHSPTGIEAGSSTGASNCKI